MPIKGFGFREFTCKEDVWDAIDMLIEETIHINSTSNKQFDVSMSVKSQIPFFACSNNIFNSNLQKDIKRYMYCKENSVPPYSGSFGDQPFIWVEKYFIIKNAFAKLEKSIIDKQKDKQKGK